MTRQRGLKVLAESVGSVVILCKESYIEGSEGFSEGFAYGFHLSREAAIRKAKWSLTRFNKSSPNGCAK